MSTQQPGAAPLLNQEEIKEEKKETNPTLALEVFGLQCEFCEEKFDPDEVFICKHLECAKKISIHCEDCATFKHRKKAHKFRPSATYVICIQDLYTPDQTNFENAKEKAVIVLERWRVENFLFSHLWKRGFRRAVSIMGVAAGSSGVSSAVTTLGAASSLVFAPNAISAMGTTLGAVGAVAFTVLESAFIWRQWYLGKIPTKEAFGLTAISVVSNAATVGGCIGGAALGAQIGSALGVPAGPGGIAIGLAVGALLGVLCGFVSRFAADKIFEMYLKDKNKLEKKLVQEALKFFFPKDKGIDINDNKKFNDKILRRRYHKLALIHYPDMEGGDQDEWMKLSSYYGILTGIWEKMNKESVEINSAEDLNEEQRTLLLNEAIKAEINTNAESSTL